MAPYVRDFMKDQDFDFLCFQETIMQDFPKSWLRQIDPGKNYLWDWIPAHGSLWGILSGLKLDRFDIRMRSQGDHMLQHKLWDKKMDTKWNVLNVYGPVQDEEKDGFLAELASFCLKCQEPYIVGGNFNILRFSFEKNKTFSPNRFSDTYNVVIQVNDLRELCISGGMFTWSNNHTNPTLERLDRILLSREWELLFPSV
jgi:exonuclease III